MTVRAALQRLDALAEAFPALRSPEAQRRLAAFLRLADGHGPAGALNPQDDLPGADDLEFEQVRAEEEGPTESFGHARRSTREADRLRGP